MYELQRFPLMDYLAVLSLDRIVNVPAWAHAPNWCTSLLKWWSMLLALAMGFLTELFQPKRTSQGKAQFNGLQGKCLESQ